MSVRIFQPGDVEREARSALDARELHRALARGPQRRGGLPEGSRRGDASSFRTFDILGTGATFSRSSEASYYTQAPTDDEGDVSGKAFLAWAGVNVPRIDSRDGVPMLLLEGSRTNLRLQNQTFSGDLVIGTPTITDNADGAPDGAATSRRIVASSAQAAYRGTSGLTIGQPYAFSWWARGVSGGSDPMVTRVGNPDTAAAVNGSSHPATAWLRHIMKVTVDATNPNVMNQEGRDTSGIGGLAAGSRDGMVALPQIEGGSLSAGSFASSVIRTTGTSATRALESLSIAAGSWPQSMTTRGFRFGFRPICTSAEFVLAGVNMQLLSIGAGNTNLAGLFISGGTAKFRIYSTTLPAVIDQTVSWTSRDQALSITIEPNAGRVTLSGFTTGDGVYTASEWGTDWLAAYAGAVLYVGNNNTNVRPCYGRFPQRWVLL